MCVSEKKNMHKRILSKDTKKGIVSNKIFWDFDKPFLINFSQNDAVLIKNSSC